MTKASYDKIHMGIRADSMAYTITGPDGSTFVPDIMNPSGDLAASLDVIPNITADGKVTAPEQVVIFEENITGEYNFIPIISGNDVNVYMATDSLFAQAKANSSDGVTFDTEGSVTLDINDGDFYLSLTLNDVNSKWTTVRLTGSTTSDSIKLEERRGCYILTGNDLTDVALTIKNRDETAELMFTTDAGSVLITDSGDDAAIYIDSMGEGRYDTMVGETHVALYELTLVDGLMGDILYKISVPHGETLELPAPPEHPGHEFSYWDGACENVTHDDCIIAVYDGGVDFEPPATEPPVSEVPTTEPPISEVPTTEPPVSEPPVMGDINGNGALDAGDATIVLRCAVGIVVPTSEQVAVADMNKNGELDAGDATIILRTVVGA